MPHGGHDGQEDPLTELRDRLSDCLARSGMTKTQLAARSGLGRTTVQEAFRQGGAVPSAATVVALARVLRLPVAELLDLRRAAAHAVGPPPVPGPVRSAYLRQVEQIAPPRLLDREAELDELAGFCLAEENGPYVWWQAGPWAGKSALLSTFVRTAPDRLAASGVRVVSFFITARLAAQDTREAFTTTLIEQLCALLHQDLPADGDEAARERALLDLLAEAAAACRQEGGRLVVVVDGLDEDRGVTTGPGAHSIAGLLPGDPQDGMRVIVAGRLNPPVPDDVPGWHPLHDPGIVRRLGDSLHAQGQKRLGRSELKRLLKGTPVEQDLLGLITAARGGLSGPDLRELTGTDLWAVEEILHTVAGRTFTRRLARWAPDDGPQVYLLGHEELHNAACDYLGDDRLTHYRNRLHAWAEAYRAPTDGRPSWPPRTPEYLLTGYPRMLATAGDTDRLTALAVDPERHDRMLDLTGGDTAALTEIKTCQDLLLARPETDLYALARLSHHRGQLESSNHSIPTTLPSMWATLGQPNRAEQLARSLTDPDQQAQALTRVAEAVARAGDHEHARRLATRAEHIARTLTNPDQQAQALAEVAEAVARTGDHKHAEQLAQTITNPNRQAWALTRVAEAVAGAGDHEHAEQLARSLTGPNQRARALAEVAEAVARTGDHEHAEQLARTITNPNRQARALTRVAEAVAAAGDHEHARQLATHAEHIARTLTNPDQQAQALAEVAEAMAGAGDHEHARQLATHAEHIARTLSNPDRQARALARVGEAVAQAGDHEHARRLATRAERIARTLTNPDQQAQALVEVVETVARTGDHEHAEQLARTITGPNQQAQALVGVAKSVGLPRASRLLGEAFALGEWLTPLLVLAQLYPHEVIRIADAVYADGASSHAL